MNPKAYPDGCMDEKECYEWGNTFAASWDECVAQMSSRATVLGLEQEATDGCITWKDGDEPRTRFVFAHDGDLMVGASPGSMAQPAP